MPALVATIAAELATWEECHVELAIFGTDEPAGIAAALDRACEAAIGSGIAEARFYTASIGAVAGVELDDGRAVVIKCHQPTVARATLDEVCALRRPLALSPAVLAGPIPIARGHAVIEAFDTRGELADAHEPAIRRALAASLRAIVETCRPAVARSRLDPVLAPPADSLWPTPHSKLFDFAATARGAEWIDDLARAARDQLARAGDAGELVIGHADWRAEHVRFVGDRPIVAYDWDSLRRTREPALVGMIAHAFCANWSRDDRAQAPTVEEARAFVTDYEAARGAAFTADERRACAATFAYACAYSARCAYALRPGERDRVGTFQHLVTRGRELLAL